MACPSFFPTNLLQQWRGPESMKATAAKMMARSGDTLDGVADRVFDGFDRGRFLILPTRGAAMHWRLRRWLPSLYFRQLMAQVAPRPR